jgi:replicative DNA helicase
MATSSKIVSPRAELAVLRGLCHKDRAISGTLISSVDDSYFHSPESVELYEAILKNTVELGKTPSFKLMLEDPDISTEARQHFRDSVATVQSVQEAAKAARILNKYRQKRGLYNMTAYLGEQLKGSRMDVDTVLQKAATALNVIRSKKSTDESFLHFGKNNSSMKIVDSILDDDNSDDIIPTGFEAFDDVSGGISRGSLFTVGGTSGAGKSLLASAMAINMASMGYKVLIVPLEMSKREMTMRIMANVSKTDFTKIRLQRLATGEKELVRKRYKRWVRRVKEKGGRYTIFKPEEDMSIEEIYASVNAYDSDVVIVDYISLLKGVDGADQWRQLGAVARYAKINAENTNRVNVLLCQVNPDGVIRYSKAISEHSSASWVFCATKETKETGITKVEQPKSRNSLSFPFTVKIDYATMRVLDAPMDDNLGAIESSNKKDKALPNLAVDV